MKSYLSHLECTTCGKTHAANQLIHLWHRLHQGALSPLGPTPILDARRLGEAMGASNLVVKDEGQDPTGTFESRGISAAVSKAKELGGGGRSPFGPRFEDGLGPTGAAK